MRNFTAALALLCGSAAAQVVEEPPLINAELTFTDGSVILCLFDGAVDIDSSGEVFVEGCGQENIVCSALDVAEINTYGPFVAATGCAEGSVLRDGFERKE